MRPSFIVRAHPGLSSARNNPSFTREFNHLSSLFRLQKWRNTHRFQQNLFPPKTSSLLRILYSLSVRSIFLFPSFHLFLDSFITMTMKMKNRIGDGIKNIWNWRIFKFYWRGLESRSEQFSTWLIESMRLRGFRFFEKKFTL